MKMLLLLLLFFFHAGISLFATPTDTVTNLALSTFFSRNNCDSNHIGAEGFEYQITTKEFYDTARLNLPHKITLDSLNTEAQDYANKNGNCILRCRKNGENIVENSVCCEGLVRVDATLLCHEPKWSHRWKGCSQRCNGINTDIVECKAGTQVMDESFCKKEPKPASSPSYACSSGLCYPNGTEVSAASDCASEKIYERIEVANRGGWAQTNSWTKNTAECNNDAQNLCNKDGWPHYGYGNVLHANYTYNRFSNSTCDIQCGTKQLFKTCVAPNYGQSCQTSCSNTGATIDMYGNCSAGWDGCSQSNDDSYSDCFLSHTRILMADGSYRPIEKINVGDKVLGRDKKSNTVLNISKHLTTEKKYGDEKGESYFYGINGSQEFVTGGHPFLDNKGNWKVFDLANSLNESEIDNHIVLKLSAINIGDTLYNGTIIHTISKIKIKTVKYNLDVDGDNTFIANGEVVHNKSLSILKTQ